MHTTKSRQGAREGACGVSVLFRSHTMRKQGTYHLRLGPGGGQPYFLQEGHKLVGPEGGQALQCDGCIPILLHSAPAKANNRCQNPPSHATAHMAQRLPRGPQSGNASAWISKMYLSARGCGGLRWPAGQGSGWEGEGDESTNRHVCSWVLLGSSPIGRWGKWRPALTCGFPATA